MIFIRLHCTLLYCPCGFRTISNGFRNHTIAQYYDFINFGLEIPYRSLQLSVDKIFLIILSIELTIISFHFSLNNLNLQFY